jgi:NodT family efflux transporter outer membrane factor (OMF) lipoprotein
MTPPWRALAAAATAAVALEACAVGPRYAAPPPPAHAAAPFKSARPDLSAPGEPPGDWWRLYDDVGLDAVVGEALKANTDLRAAEANLRAARAVLAGARAGLYPSTQATASATYGRDELANLLAADVGARAGADWLDTTSFAVAYQLDLFGQIRRGIQAARADAEASVAARDAARVLVAAQTAGAYADACALAGSIAVARRSLALAGRIEEATRLRRADGVETSLDEARAQALTAQTAAAVPPLQVQRRSALFVLAALMGRTPADLPASAVSCSQPLTLSVPIPVGDGAALIRRRPDLRLAERNLAAATARIGVATAALYPAITLGGSVALTSNRPEHLADYVSQSWGLGPSVSWTFPNQAPVRARIRQATAQAQAALARLDGSVLQALAETEQALAVYGAERDRRAQLTLARDRAAEALRLARLQRREGVLPYLDLLSAEQTLIGADAALAASDRQIAADQVAVFKALGGGWQAPPAPGTP